MRATLDGDASLRIRGGEADGPGRILDGLLEAGARNPVFLLEAIDRVEPDAADALARRTRPGALRPVPGPVRPSAVRPVRGPVDR